MPHETQPLCCQRANLGRFTWSWDCGTPIETHHIVVLGCRIHKLANGDLVNSRCNSSMTRCIRCISLVMSGTTGIGGTVKEQLSLRHVTATTSLPPSANESSGTSLALAALARACWASHDSPTQTWTFEGPGLQNTTKIPREDTQRDSKRAKWWRERGTKERNFGRSPPPLEGGPGEGGPGENPKKRKKKKGKKKQEKEV